MKKFKTPFVFLLLGLISSISTSGQVLTDFLKSDTIQIDIEILKQYQTEWQNQQKKFLSLSKKFCLLNSKDKDKAAELLDLVLQNSFIQSKLKHEFLVKNSRCFSLSQKKEIITWLDIELNPNDFYYDDLVSKFKLTSKKETFKANDSETLFSFIMEDLEDGKIEEIHTEHLRSLASLSNLGLLSDSDFNKVLDGINNLYSYFLDNDKLQIFYTDILSNSIALMDSKKAIIETIYLLDIETTKSNDIGEETGFSPALSYFLSCVNPKLNTSKLKLMAWTDFEKNKEAIKRSILNDNSIWLDHIKT